MAHFAEMLHHAKEGTATDEMWQEFKRAGDAYRNTLAPGIPREAQWMANEWGHRIQLVILTGHLEADGRDFITCKREDYRAVLDMPGNGICHAARAVAERMLASL